MFREFTQFEKIDKIISTKRFAKLINLSDNI